MTAFEFFLLETAGASVILVVAGVAGVKLVVNRLLDRDFELHKMRLKEASDRELARVREEFERAAGESPKTPSVPSPDKLVETTGELFRLFDDATLGVVRFALEFRAEKIEAADEAGRAAIEKTAALSNFARLNRRYFSKTVADSIEASAAPLSELAWRSYKTFKDPALSEKETAQEIRALDAEALALGRQIETVKRELAGLIENEGRPAASTGETPR